MIKTGLEIFINDISRYKNRAIALIANQTSVTGSLDYNWEALKKKGLRIKRIFSPEHGLFGTEQDQDAVKSQPFPGAEIVSLYGTDADSLIPDLAQLDGIDTVVFDIQDIGARYYTYLNTMALFMKALRGRDIEFIVLDRPNPLGGNAVEGPGLKKEFESFVGIFPVPVRHGMTAGELALLYKKINSLDINLSIIKMSGWKRKMLFRDTGLRWIPPSPNMPDEYTAYLYPGMCLLEGTNISEGRGTTTPFKNIGAPFIDPIRLAEHLNSMNPGGVKFRPVWFKPTFNKYSGITIGGVYSHITDMKKFRPFLTGVAAVKAIRDLYKDDFTFLKGVYEFNDIHPAFDLLAGSPEIREMIINNYDIGDIAASWEKGENAFRQTRKEFLIYR